MQYISINKVC